MQHNLVITNSLSGKKEKFEPLNPPFVGLYVCGPTVYSDVHLGNCRTFISFDMVYRYLTHLGYKVRYVRNITDAGHLESDADVGEDKIAKKARLEQIEPMEIVQRYTVDFHRILRLFNTVSPSIEPTATGHIVEQIEMIKSILDKGLAYEKNGSVYFDVRKYNETNNYGELSGRKIDELLETTRALDGQQEKNDARDFALWKKASPEHIMRWPSPWGIGFPGWHLECSVMSSKYLGNQFDIHGGGMDLKFPHHECEIAQCTAANNIAPVKYWMHGNMLTLNGAKMSKSTGNTLLPDELISGDNGILEKGYHPSVVRFFMMQAHYTSTLDFSSAALAAAEKGFERLMSGVDTLNTLKTSNNSSFDVDRLIHSFYSAMDDDFNTPILIAHLFDAVKKINAVAAEKETISSGDLEHLKNEIHSFVFNVLGLEHINENNNSGNDLSDELMQLILNLRKEAKENKDYATADKLRDQLAELNISIKDSKDGATWEIG